MLAQIVPKIDPTKTRKVNFRTKAVTINASKAPTSRRTLSTFIFADNAAFAAMLTIANDDKTSNATVNIPS